MIIVRPHVILRGLLYIVLSIGLLYTLPALVAWFYGEAEELMLFLLCTVAYAGSSSLALRLWRAARGISIEMLSGSEALLLSALAWLVAAAVAMTPYVRLLGLSPMDAYFEAMSGLTTTGATVLTALEELPRSVLFWRSMTQWIGGVGIILLFLLLYAAHGPGLWRLYLAEAREQRLAASTKETVKRIWLIYVFYTVVCALTLKFVGGMPLFDAVNHTFTVLSTGGFSTRTRNIEAFGDPKVELVLLFFMLVGGINFFAHYLALARGPKELLGYFETKALLAVWVVATAIVAYDLVAHGYSVYSALRYSSFQTASIMTTTGYTSTDINGLPTMSKTILLLLMFVGGSTGSTAGAIKLARVVVTFHIGLNAVRRMIYPHGVIIPLRVGGRSLATVDVVKVSAFIFFYMLMFLTSTMLFVYMGYQPFEAASLAATAQGNVGPAFADPAQLSAYGKALFIFLMWAGRLELFPALILLAPDVWRGLARSHVRERRRGLAT